MNDTRVVVAQEVAEVYEAPAIESIVSAADLTREVQYAGLGTAIIIEQA